MSSTGMTRYKPYLHAAANRHPAIHSRYLQIPLTSSGMTVVRVSFQRPYDVIPVLDTGIQEFY
ncbi:hypothetical protein [Wolbachia endosymbiont (group A) of Brachyopa scutellaris]|uniref:hypothetical protein n=1 Tax=Wolbachia endosymbiont (group A) of Brachyopa scutellaris TaxID=3066140 RepID=UPI003132CE4C